ncbi:MAG: hypothetical protein JO356_01525, partial [Acidobacteria bacterium]|nr:hypothetical protein [Acidobacteriota bacterium]
MPRIPILKLGSAEPPEPPRLVSYEPVLSLEGLQLGIDNLRHDVWLSPKVCRAVRDQIQHLTVKYGNVENVVAAGASDGSGPSAHTLGKPSSGTGKNADLKQLLADLHKCLLNRAKGRGEPRIDVLGRTAVIQFLRAELNDQYAQVLERCRATLKAY